MQTYLSGLKRVLGWSRVGYSRETLRICVFGANPKEEAVSVDIVSRSVDLL